jgi:8-oxo-dGTP diphosphatase
MRGADGVIIGCCSLIADGGRYLLVREAKESARRRYNLPAGKPELGETLIEAAVREAREETGLDVDIAHLVGIYHCPKTSEGFGVVNFVFAAQAASHELASSPQHPEVRSFSREEIADLAADGLIRGTHIQRAIDDYEAGKRLPLSLVQVVPASRVVA